jgi:2-polyprenyl-3-methyl-5-hydroxy-6-metoxy-1,4-benzoquinol methylase
MRSETGLSYRARVYDQYVTGRDTPLAPRTIAELRPRFPLFRRIVKRHFPSDLESQILDLGCGHGAFLHVMREAGYKNARGIDGSPEQVSAARALGILGVEQGDVISLLSETATGSIDVIVTFDLIEHFDKAELMPLIDEIYRVLKETGRWIIHAPNAESPFGSWIRYGDFTHEIAFTRASMAQLLRASGFKSVVCYEDQPIPHGLTSTVRYILWNMIRIGLLGYIAIETGLVDTGAVFTQNFLTVARRK